MGQFQIGDRVRKIKGSDWKGRIVGTYSTTLTPEGYAVESECHPGSVQIYPGSALEHAPALTWLDRVASEKAELDKKIRRLRDAFDGTSGIGKRNLLKKQLRVMDKYSRLLGKRIWRAHESA